MKNKRLEIIILGMGPTRGDCPYDAEVWGVNNGYRQIAWHNRDKAKAQPELDRLESLIAQNPEEEYQRREDIDEARRLLTVPDAHIDKLFICHKGQEYDQQGDPIFNFDEVNDLARNGVEVVSLFKVKELDKITRMSFSKLSKKFQTEYFSDTISYMIAYALDKNTRRVNGILKLKQPMRIRMYGVDMHTQDEYATERGGIEYFVAIAKTLGVEFWIHPDSSVCKTVNQLPYGFYKMKKKAIDPLDVLKLQKTERGLNRLVNLGIISKEEYKEMLGQFKTRK